MKREVLIAESHPELREMYQRSLLEGGFAVRSASDGLDCLEKLRRRSPAVLVLDGELRWGGADGVLAWLREEESMSEVAVVLTGLAGHSALGAADLHPPVTRFLAKPFGMRVLLDCVRGALAEMGRGYDRAEWCQKEGVSHARAVTKDR